ncbi:uncharacterized protein LOC105641315 [Jatropha curcas]|uniref:uncharacterized protein LOC105641315 n=1 Tax=Jatropha curcas TaxID=180498 RepID=UPI0005FBF03D|nr:uncharacterized protein LOC105641315 [Jatropha curcas]
MATPYSPIIEHEDEGYEYDYEEEASSSSGCNCFRVFCFRKFKKVKEVSEVVAGPKWKTFIRKISLYFNKQKNNHHHNNNSQFQYDPQSYALNFDDGGADRREEDGLLLPAFSSRFTTVNEKRQNGL